MAALTARVARLGAHARTAYICSAVFVSWFAAYGLRKPWGAGLYDGERFFGLPPKDAIALSQTIGYMLGKWLSTGCIPRLGRRQRLPLLLFMTAACFLPLVAFALVESTAGRVLAIFVNQWPLGWFHGTLYLYLEGRQGAELLGGAISAAYILGSGFAKSLGASLLEYGVSLGSMPLAAGAISLPVAVLAMLLLDTAPEPSEREQAVCGSRRPMSSEEQSAFLRRYSGGLVLHTIGYIALTGLKDFRDSFQADIWQEVYGSAMPAAAFGISELVIAGVVLGVLALLSVVKSSAKATLLMEGLMLSGALLLVVAQLGSGWSVFTFISY